MSARPKPPAALQTSKVGKGVEKPCGCRVLDLGGSSNLRSTASGLHGLGMLCIRIEL